MKVSLVSSTILILATCLDSASTAHGPVVSCCLQVSNTRVRAERIHDYYIQQEAPCPVYAIVFNTLSGKRICSDPNNDWAKRTKNKVDEKKRANDNAGGPPSTAAPEAINAGGLATSVPPEAINAGGLATSVPPEAINSGGLATSVPPEAINSGGLATSVPPEAINSGGLQTTAMLEKSERLKGRQNGQGGVGRRRNRKGKKGKGRKARGEKKVQGKKIKSV